MTDIEAISWGDLWNEPIHFLLSNHTNIQATTLPVYYHICQTYSPRQKQSLWKHPLSLWTTNNLIQNFWNVDFQLKNITHQPNFTNIAGSPADAVPFFLLTPSPHTQPLTYGVFKEEEKNKLPGLLREGFTKKHGKLSTFCG